MASIHLGKRHFLGKDKQAWERRSFGETWGKAWRIGTAQPLRQGGMMPMRPFTGGFYLGKKNKDLKSDASEHVFHSFVQGASNVIQWIPMQSFALFPG